MTAKTSDDEKPCVVGYPGGTIRRANGVHVRIDTRDDARRKLREDKAAGVTYEEYERLQAEMTR